MIIDRENKILFIKTKKTAGTSFEISLSKYCGINCVVTPITPVDEKLRQSLGFRSAQNYNNYVWREAGIAVKGAYFNHMPAPVVKNLVPKEIWSEYKKITIVRNPYDVAISRYYWEGGERTGVNFLEYLRKFPNHLSENATIAPPEGEAKLDVYLRYENLKEDLRNADLGYIWETFNSIRAKDHMRPKTGTSMDDVYDRFPEAVEIIQQQCAEEIDKFEYQLEQKSAQIA